MITIGASRSPWRLFLVPVGVGAGLGLLFFYVGVTPGKLSDTVALDPSFVVPRILRHVELVLVAFAAAAIAGVALGVALAGRGRWLQGLAFVPANLGQALPSIGVLALFEILTGRGFATTVEALAVYGVLPVLRNTIVGLDGVDPAALDAASGMGLTPRQLLLRVRLPLASSSIFAGLRTSMVLIVGTATIANYVGGGGLGEVIGAGLGDLSEHVILVGAGLVAAGALILDWLLGIAERVLTPAT